MSHMPKPTHTQIWNKNDERLEVFSPVKQSSNRKEQRKILHVRIEVFIITIHNWVPEMAFEPALKQWQTIQFSNF